MNAKNIYDVFRENEELKKLIDKYHKELKRKDEIIKELKNIIIDGLKKEKENEQRKQNLS